jgi:hypothetical protein
MAPSAADQRSETISKTTIVFAFTIQASQNPHCKSVTSVTGDGLQHKMFAPTAD